MKFNEEEKISTEKENKEFDNEKSIESSINENKKNSKNQVSNSTVISKDFLPENFNPFARPVNSKFFVKSEQEFEERVLEIKRVIKVTKGGRRFKFSALVVVGDKKGRVGYAIGKHIEVPEAIKKAVKQAKKKLIKVKIVRSSNTIPHEAIGHKGASRVMLKPAIEGKGIIASNIVRSVVELAGYRNIYSKNLGTNNPNNVVISTINALTQMRTAKEILELKKEIPKKTTTNESKKDSKEVE